MEDNDFGDFSSALYTSSANAAFDNVGTTSWPTVLPSAEEGKENVLSSRITGMLLAGQNAVH